MLNQIKAAIEKGVSVQIRPKNQYDQYPVIVQDITDGSITKGWSLTYYPRFTEKNGPARLYDGKEAFSSLSIANFNGLYQAIMAIDQRFASGENVEVRNDKRKGAIYELNGARFSVIEYEKNVAVNLSITSEASPFHQLSINFRIVNSTQEHGKRHLIGSEAQWDLNTDIFTEGNASLSPKKRRVLQVHQESQNSIPYVKAPGRPGYVQNTTEVDPQNSPFEYVQDVRNKFKALAVIFEQTILEVAMERALVLLQGETKQQSSPEQVQFGFGAGQGQQAFGTPVFGAHQQSFSAQPQPPAAPQSNAKLNWGTPVASNGSRVY